MSTDNFIKRARRIVGFAVAAGFAVVVLLALLAGSFPETRLRDLFATACHQYPDRSHWLGSEPVGLCVRCLWFYVGLAIGHLGLGLTRAIPRHRLAYLAASLAMAAGHWLLGWLTPAFDFVALRAGTGLLAGGAVSAYTLPGLVELIFARDRKTQTRSTIHSHEPVRT